jgi:predicted nucleic acid-binding protein
MQPESRAEVPGRLKASRDGQGLILEDDDLWIAATALTPGAVLVARDHTFTRIAGLQVEDWTV